MMVFILLATLLFGISSAQDGVKITGITDLQYVDPISIDPCYPKPTPNHPFLDWDGTYLSQEWWEYVKNATNFPRKFRRASMDAVCKKPWSPEEDNRRYYWHISCPYKVFWLSKFTWALKQSLRETCYVIFPCMQQVRIVNCTTQYCATRCRTNHPNIRNSVCLENNFQTYRKVWVFCTHTFTRINRSWQPVDCKMEPHKCLKRVTLRVPQCCECWSCWDMYVTDPNYTEKESVLRQVAGTK